MENNLEEFLSLPDVDNIIEEVYVSKRLGKFKVKAMSQETFREYQAKARSKINKKGMDFDIGKFNMLMVIGQTIYPDFSNAEFLKKANCSTAEEFISKKLLPGEITDLAAKIQEISGFDYDANEDIETAKN